MSASVVTDGSPRVGLACTEERPAGESAWGMIGRAPHIVLDVSGNPARGRGGVAWRAYVGAIAVWMGCFAAGLDAQTSLPDLTEEWRWVDYGPTSGLPGSEVRDLVEGVDAVWVLTDEALAYYDGFVWTRAGTETGLPAGVPTSLAAAPGGAIFVAVGGRVYRGGPEGFAAVRLPPPFDTVRVARVVPDSSDSFYFTVPLPVGRLEPPQSVLFHASGADVRSVSTPGPISAPTGIWRTRSGRIWIDTWRGLAVLEGAHWRLMESEAPLVHQIASVPHLAEDASGLGIAYRRSPPAQMGLLAWHGDGVARRVVGEGTNLATSLDVRGGLAVAVYATGDLRVLEGGVWRSFTLPPPRSDGAYFTRLSDGGDLWFASSQGLHRFRASERRWQRLRQPFPAGHNAVNAILVDRDGLTWLGTNAGVLKVRGTTVVDSISSILGTPLQVVTGLAQDSSGYVWLTSGRDMGGAFRWDGRSWHRFGRADGLDGGRIHRVFVDGHGDVWFMALGTTSRAGAGAYRLSGGVVTEVTRGLPRGAAYSFAEAADGTVWLGVEAGLARLRGDELVLLGTAEGIGYQGGEPPGTAVFDVAVDGKGRVWFCHRPPLERGLGYVDPDGTIGYVDPPGGKEGRRIWSVTADADGSIWVGSDAGVAHLENGVWSLFDAGTGLGAASVWPVVPRATSVLIGTNGSGFLTLDRRGSAALAPRVVVRSTYVEGRVAALDWLAFAYRGELPESRVETRLRLDSGAWSPWSTARSWVGGPLAPGSHTVHIQGKGLFGAVTDPPTTVSVRVLPPFVRRPAFFLPVGALMAALLILGAATSIRRRRHEAALRRSEERWHALVESAPEAIAIYDLPSRGLIAVNENTSRLLGVPRDSLLSLDPWTLLAPMRANDSPGREFLEEAMRRAQEGETVVLSTVLRAADGTEIPCELRVSLLSAGDREKLRVSVIDIRDRLAAEERQAELERQLRQAQRLEAVGKLTGGVAHEFNNLLTVASGNLELLLEGGELAAPEKTLALEALAATERGAELTHQLLAFSRRQPLTPRRLELGILLDGLHGLLRKALGEAVHVAVHVSPDTWPVSADYGQLQQAIVNLVMNARDAVGSGGRIIIEASNVQLDSTRDPRLEGLDPGEYVRLSVSDTGMGMAPEVAARAFDPFFTTHPPGTASGLGLSMVYGFVAQSGGMAIIDSVPGAGTTVSLFVPRSASRPA